MLTIYVDADACPVKNEVYRVAERFSLPVVLVANSPMRYPDADWIRLELVGDHGDAADDWIVEQAIADDIVITTDILLAERCVKEKSAHVITPTGKPMTLDNIGEALARRELAQRLREWGGPESGPPPFTKQNRSQFLQTLHETIIRIKRERGES